MQPESFLESTSTNNARAKKGFLNLNETFSQISRCLGPSYHHEKPERSVQMRLYTLYKGQYLLIFIMFLCLFMIAFLMGMAGPRMVFQHQEQATKLQEKAYGFQKSLIGPYKILTPHLNAYRQKLWLSAQIKLVDRFKNFTTLFKTEVSINGVIARNAKDIIKQSNVSRSFQIKCNKICESFIILHLGSFEYSYYILTVSFKNLKIMEHDFIHDIIFTTTTLNPDFTKMEIWFRFFFVLTTMIVLWYFIKSMKNFRFEDWSVEQKWTGILLPSLLCFNDPFFPFILTSKKVVSQFLDSFLQASFLFGLLLFWLCIFHGLRQTKRTFIGFYFPKILIVGSMWFSVLYMIFFEEFYQLKDPSFNYQLNIAHYSHFQSIFFINLAIYSIYIIFLALRAYGDISSLNSLDTRLKFHAYSLIVVVFLTLSVVFNRYGVEMLEDNFLARIYTSYSNKAQFLSFYMIFNCYIYILAYVYALAEKQLNENNIFKEDKSFSMFNETDEETEAMILSASPLKESNFQ